MKTIKKIFSSLGTVNTITVYVNENESEKAKKTLEFTEQYINKIDDKFSVFKNTSEISNINKNAGIKPVNVSDDTFEILKLSKVYSATTEGAFDITTKPVTDYYKNSIENVEEFNETLRKVNYNCLIIDEENQSVMLKNKWQAIDLGGIAKGYVIDKIIEIFKENKIENAIINLGGTIYNIGEKRNIGIRNPFNPINISNKDDSIITIESENEIFVTSGLYEQGEHIIDPKTCKKVKTDIISVSIIGNNGAEQDAIATACFVLGIEKSVELLKIRNLQGIFILKNGQIFATEAIQKRIKLLKEDK